MTPNWTVQLPGGRYDGEDPDGYMRKRKSSLLIGVGEDAAIVARAIAASPVAAY